MDKLLTRKAVAEALNVSDQTVDGLLESGQLQRIKVGKRRVGIPEASLAAYVQWRQEHELQTIEPLFRG